MRNVVTEPPKRINLARVFGPTSIVVWIMTLALGLLPIVTDLRATNGIKTSEFAVIGRDFVNIWHGGRVAAKDPARVYDRDAYRKDLQRDVGIGGIYAYSYPPHMLAASLPFGKIPYLVALLAWTLITGALFWHAARPLLASAGLPSWIVFLMPASLFNIFAGHFGFLVGALALYGWAAAGRAPMRSGLAFAVMTIKPHLGLLVPIILVARKRWNEIAWSALFAVGFVGLSIAIFGSELWRVWLTSTLSFQASLIGGDNANMIYLYMMPTVERMAASWGFPAVLNTVLQAGFAISVLSVLVWGWRKRLTVSDLGQLSIIGVLLMLPYVFVYDMVACNLVILVLAARFHETLSRVERSLLIFAFLVPVLHMPLARTGLSISPLFMFAALVILTRQMVEQRSASPTVIT
jgi:alpha-1,2-mannosyltransferase